MDYTYGVVVVVVCPPKVKGKWVNSNFQNLDLLVQPRAAGVAGMLIFVHTNNIPIYTVFNCKRLKILQKKAVRILAFRPYISHFTPIFKKLKIYYSWKICTLCNCINFTTKTQIIYCRHTFVALHHSTITKIIIINSGITQ